MGVRLAELLARTELPARDALQNGTTVPDQIQRDFRALCEQESTRLRELLALAGYTDSGAFEAFVARESAVAAGALAGPIAAARHTAWKEAFAQAVDLPTRASCPTLGVGTIDVAAYNERLERLRGTHAATTQQALREALFAYAGIDGADEKTIDATIALFGNTGAAHDASAVALLDEFGQRSLTKLQACIRVPLRSDDQISQRGFMPAIPFVMIAAWIWTDSQSGFACLFAFMGVVIAARFGAWLRRARDQHRAVIDSAVADVNASLARQHALWKSTLLGA